MDLYANFIRADVIDFIILLGTYSLLCILNIFLKIRFFCVENSNRANSIPEEYQLNKIFWRLFKFDFLTFQVPIVLISMTNKIWKVYIWISLVFLAFFSSIVPRSITIKANMSYLKLVPASTNLDTKIIRLSVNMFRTLLFFITSDCILAVDFPYFSMQKAKTHEFGVSLMDIGVGYFIICHAMRLIRNMSTEPEIEKVNVTKFFINVHNTIKKSSVLFILGVIRYASLKLLGYSVNINEYGVHWNFFFTIFFVKVFSSFFDIFIKNSAKRAFILSILIGSFYQWILTYKTDYLLEYYGQRKTYVDKNKEGIYSTVGYTSMYFLSEAVCFHLRKVLNKKENSARFIHSVSIRCGVFLVIYSILFFVLTHLSSFFIQDISRRICNLSFIFHTLTTACFLWSILVFGNILTVQLLKKLLKRTIFLNQVEMDNILNALLDVTHSFYRIADSKFVGLAIFLIANVFTGIVNISIIPQSCSYPLTVIILSVNLLISSVLPFAINNYKNKINLIINN